VNRIGRRTLIAIAVVAVAAMIFELLVWLSDKDSLGGNPQNHFRYLFELSCVTKNVTYNWGVHNDPEFLDRCFGDLVSVDR
jgi:hypothetical protein